RGARTRLTSWPGYRLPSAPGEMTIAIDPADEEGRVRPTCDAEYGAEDPSAECQGTPHCHGDLDQDSERAGTPGRQKLLVTLVEEVGVAVIDAQAILDQEAGAFEPCLIERWLPLQVILPPADDPPPPPAEPRACVEPDAS